MPSIVEDFLDIKSRMKGDQWSDPAKPEPIIAGDLAVVLEALKKSGYTDCNIKEAYYVRTNARGTKFYNVKCLEDGELIDGEVTIDKHGYATF